MGSTPGAGLAPRGIAATPSTTLQPKPNHRLSHHVEFVTIRAGGPLARYACRCDEQWQLRIEAITALGLVFIGVALVLLLAEAHLSTGAARDAGHSCAGERHRHAVDAGDARRSIGERCRWDTSQTG